MRNDPALVIREKILIRKNSEILRNSWFEKQFMNNQLTSIRPNQIFSYLSEHAEPDETGQNGQNGQGPKLMTWL